jgi:hypothetical protein
MTNDALAEAISRSDAALQEALSASLVAEQMIRHGCCLWGTHERRGKAVFYQRKSALSTHNSLFSTYSSFFKNSSIRPLRIRSESSLAFA